MTLIPLTRTTKMTQEQLDRFTVVMKTILGTDEPIVVVENYPNYQPSESE
jgi:hypothetical protein